MALATLLSDTRLAKAQTNGNGYAIHVSLVGSGLQYGSLELRRRGSDAGEVRAVTSAWELKLSGVTPGAYDLYISAPGFNNLTQTITINRDIDLGRIFMDRDPTIRFFAGSGSFLHVPDPRKQVEQTSKVEAGEQLRTVRGRIQAASFFEAKPLTVQVSCAAKAPALPPSPQVDLSLVVVDDTGSFEVANPDCSGESLAHRELRFSVRDVTGKTVALLLPMDTMNEYRHSKCGLWLPLAPLVPGLPTYEAIFEQQLTDSCPMDSELFQGESMGPPPPQFTATPQVVPEAVHQLLWPMPAQIDVSGRK